MKPKITNSRMYLSDEWYLEHDEQSTNLVNEEVRPNKKGIPTNRDTSRTNIRLCVRAI